MRGFVFYDGPSAIDGSPILGIAVLHSENRKTGDMVQTYIIRSDMAPMEAIKTGADFAICGNCAFRAGEDRPRICYVEVGKSVTSVFSAWCRGAYPMLSPEDAADILADRMVRIGAYGDGAMIPADAWRGILAKAKGWTGYSHQWREAFAQGMRGLCMASADTAADAADARAAGWRYFVTRRDGTIPAAGEIDCPASESGGFRRQCVTCGACDGAASGRERQVSVSIVVHGPMARHFNLV